MDCKPNTLILENFSTTSYREEQELLLCDKMKNQGFAFKKCDSEKMRYMVKS